MRTRTILASVVLTCFAACGERAPDEEPATGETTAVNAPEPAAPAAASGPPCPEPPPCGDDCSNHPFTPNDCWTTPFGPARADVILGNPLTSSNMLYCDEGAYALCFFSGPPYATGKPDAGNQPLPCVLEEGGGTARCTCEVYTSGACFVDINAILNQGAYYETVEACGKTGERCANIGNCGPDGAKRGCGDHPRAPVCRYVRDQDPDDPAVSLMPKADVVSTFSFAMNDDYQMGSTACPAAPYAGCMTAPCFFAADDDSPPEDGETVQCECPVYDGVYQVGQPNRTDCSIQGGGTYVWSAARSVTP